jgi:hypothetical protein
MILEPHNHASTRALVNGFTGAAPPSSDSTECTLLAVGHDWRPGRWRHDLAAAPDLSAVGIRLADNETTPDTSTWADIARTVTRAITWDQANWLALRTTSRSLIILAATEHQPTAARLDTVAAAIRRIHRPSSGRPVNDADKVLPLAPPGPPMRLLDAQIGYFKQIDVLVTHVPALDELRFTPYPLPPDARIDLPPQSDPPVLYVAVHPGGYVDFLLDDGDGQGYGGAPFDLHLHDGTTRVLVGPWSSNGDAVARYAPATDIHPMPFTLYENADDFRAGRHGWTGHLTQPAAEHAFHLAARHHQRAVPTAAPDRSNGTATEPAIEPTESALSAPRRAPGTPRRCR